jgi:hypothetical protein
MALALATSNAVPEMPGQDGYDRTGRQRSKRPPSSTPGPAVLNFNSLCKQSKAKQGISIACPEEIRYDGTNATDISDAKQIHGLIPHGLVIELDAD